MKRYLRLRHASRILAIGFIVLGGCQMFEVRPPSRLTSASEKTPKLNAAQLADVKIALALSLEQRGDSDGAEAAYLDAIKQNPKRADAYVRLAALRDRQGKFGETAELYRTALSLKPGNPDIFCDIGYSYYLQRRWADAEMNLRQALALRPDHQLAHNDLGLVLVQTNKFEEALAEFHRAGCSQADARNNLAFGLTLQGRLPEARQQYAFALQLDPSLSSAHEALKHLDAIVAKVDRTGPRPGNQPESAPATNPSPVVPAAFVSLNAAASTPPAHEK